MKNAMIICAALGLIALFAAPVSAGDVASVPATTLSSMGFGGVQIMSDDAGLAVRGKGTSASVWGGSSVLYTNRNGGAEASNSYAADASHYRGSSSAVGGSLSFAGNATSYGHGTKVSVNFAGGGAFARAR
ncbi:MAG: hypothetical protein AB7O59_20650 [Pirellulales bacterium]